MAAAASPRSLTPVPPEFAITPPVDRSSTDDPTTPLAQQCLAMSLNPSSKPWANRICTHIEPLINHVETTLKRFGLKPISKEDLNTLCQLAKTQQDAFAQEISDAIEPSTDKILNTSALLAFIIFNLEEFGRHTEKPLIPQDLLTTLYQWTMLPTELSLKDSKLESGAFSSVYQLKYSDTSGFVIKGYDLKQSQGEQGYAAEVKALLTIPPHENIVSLLGVTLHHELIFNSYAGGDLFMMITQYPMGDEAYHRIALGVLRGLSHLKKHHVVHCDIKPENIVLTTRDPQAEPVIIDLGLSHIQATQDSCDNIPLRGSTNYVPPEYVTPFLTNPSRCPMFCPSHLGDVWSAGATFLVLSYQVHLMDALLDRNTGPEGPSKAELHYLYVECPDQVQTNINNLLDHETSTATKIALAQITKSCLTVDPKKRASAQELLDLQQNKS